MLESWPVSILVGTVLGTLSGLGVGGGSLLLMWLTLVLGMEPVIARGINLLFFLPASAVACLFRWKQGILPWKTVLPAAIAGTVSAAAASLLSQNLDTSLLKKLFGGLLILTALRELTYRPK